MHTTVLALLLLASQSLAIAVPQTIDIVTRAEPISSRYLIQLKPSADAKHHLDWIQHVHNLNTVQRRALSLPPLAGVAKDIHIGDGFKAYTGEFDDSTIEAIKASQDVLIIEKDQKIYLETQPSRVDHMSHSSPRALAEQPPVGWNLRVISQRPPAKLDGTYYPPFASGQFAYILDTGIQVSHTEFEGRAINGYSAYPGTFEDKNGHGTHVAGIIGSRKYGVVKQATLVSVKVFDGNSGSTSVILDGISWSVNNIKTTGRVGKAVLNLSIGGGYSQVLNNAVKSAYDQGILSAVASGGEAQDVKNVSPASAPDAITVAAMDSSYRVASSSNYGAGLDLYAPGVLITSTWIGSGNTASNTISGSSLAAPHAAAAVLALQARKAGQSPLTVRDYLVNVASKNALSGVPAGTANLLLFIDS